MSRFHNERMVHKPLPEVDKRFAGGTLLRKVEGETQAVFESRVELVEQQHRARALRVERDAGRARSVVHSVLHWSDDRGTVSVVVTAVGG